ncbi:MAG: hypothetical protein AAFY21_15220, partial [Cyanobacteria bacterium J06641_2]
MLSFEFISILFLHYFFSPNSCLEKKLKADKQNTLKRTRRLTQSNLSDFVYEPGNSFQSGVDNG